MRFRVWCSATDAAGSRWPCGRLARRLRLLCVRNHSNHHYARLAISQCVMRMEGLLQGERVAEVAWLEHFGGCCGAWLQWRGWYLYHDIAIPW